MDENEENGEGPQDSDHLERASRAHRWDAAVKTCTVCALILDSTMILLHADADASQATTAARLASAVLHAVIGLLS
ncbi:hypothetical protein [Nocardia sp. NPDC051463]|uniref:hypothetical protein n=1 Tax=Nocardia sp. NPDC051463 TaxID=3154845 RepID=UPI00344F0FF5